MGAHEAVPDDADGAPAGAGPRQPTAVPANGGELTRAEALITQLWDDLASLRSLHAREVAQLRRDYEERIRDLRRQLAEPRDGHGGAPVDAADVDRMRARLDEVEEELEDVYESETWKVGRALVYLPRQAKLSLQEWWRGRLTGRR